MSTCLNNTSVAACHNNGTSLVTAVIHYTFDNAGAPAVRITDVAGVPIAGATAANTLAGSCPVSAPDVEWELLCDKLANGTIVEFFRRSVSYFTPTTSDYSQQVSDFALDKVTPYVVAGVVDVCSSCSPLAARGLQAAW